MAFTKIFGTTAGAYSTSTNWKPIDLTNPLYAWTVSSLGTNEYFVRTAALANPGFAASPPTTGGVYLNGADATKGTLGSLTAGQWGYGDNDTLGYSTVYVRTSGGVDPDTLDPFYVKFYQIPQATENVVFASDSASINSAVGLDQGGVAINNFIVEKGYQGTIGSATLGYLYIDPDYFEFSGSGEAWIDIGAAAIGPRVLATGGGTTGTRGLYLRGTGMTVLDIREGRVGIAWNSGEVATATTIRLLGGNPSVWLGSGLSLTNLHIYGGDDTKVRCGYTTGLQYAGKIITEGTGAITTHTQYGGEFTANSSGTITTYNHRAGLLDEMKSGAARTISTYNFYQGAQLRRNKEAVTHTTDAIQESMSINYGPIS